MKDLEAYLNLPWQPVIDTVTEGEDVQVRLTVPGLPDFAVYGDSVTEVKARWREALASHLDGYLRVGKFIPQPVEVDVVVTEPARGTASDASGEVIPRQPLQPA
jgi:predicted RNase H-like HicB family nuclease